MKQHFFLIIVGMVAPLTCGYIYTTVENHTNNNHFTSNAGILVNYAHFSLGSLPDYSGCLAGLHLNIEHQYKEYIHTELRFDGLWNAGTLHGCNNLQAAIKDFRTTFDVGYFFRPCSTIWHLEPFIGIEFIYLSNKLRPLNRQYRYYIVNIPIGFLSEWNLYDDFTVGLSFQYALEAWQQFDLTAPEILERPNISCCNNTINIELSRSYGIHVEVPLTKKIPCECCDFVSSFVPFFDWQRLGKSDSHSPIIVPHLTQWYLGAHFDIGVTF